MPPESHREILPIPLMAPSESPLDVMVDINAAASDELKGKSTHGSLRIKD
jgi:hypothetical protein